MLAGRHLATPSGLGHACLVTHRRMSASFLLKLAPTAANIEAHVEPLYVALETKQASGRAHACSFTQRARRGRRIKLFGWLES